MKIHRIIITPGEPAGIGPDIVVKLSQKEWPVELVICADKKLIQKRANLLGFPLKLLPYIPNRQPILQRAGTLTILSIPLYSSVEIGKVNVKNSPYVIDTLSRACNGCKNGEFSALVTGPVHKAIINNAGISFTGQTEFFEKKTKCLKAVMMLVAKTLRVALVTTHLPIKKVSTMITKDLLFKVITILHYELCKKFKIKKPRILVCGLNPHAGEDGYIGREEIDIIIPVLQKMKKEIHVRGPFSADTLFQPKYLNNADVILTMYHDQGLPILKYHGFFHGVNITLGLPFIRTSVDHGTALDLAGKGNANANSLIMAVNTAIKMIMNIQ